MENIQFISDLHLDEPFCSEYFQSHPIDVMAKYLVIGGDLCDHDSLNNVQWFFDWCSLNYEQTYILYGNHDCFGITNLEQLLNGWNENIRSNVHYVNNSSILINSTEIFFTTLWSELDINDKQYLLNKAVDFDKIKYNTSTPLSFELYNHAHTICRNWLKEKIHNSKAQHKIVFSHHCPTTSLSPKKDSLFSLFRSNDEDLMKGVNLWVYGHTHFNTPPKWFEETLLVSNQFGHFKEKDHTDWGPQQTTNSVYQKEFKSLYKE
ncbi:ser/thr protein phosphatase family protein [Entamoeba histolytica HM-3:IMSS]|uniref:Ser/thr protein phosphatase family protein n=5 Tax=Entamoeba histolytica TaxID=5759 RepID=C4M2R8_ENTH1|nr:ser/thr protein phosphatase family protein [Entamoeba histolytica HM-1:IMSS]EMD45999.1 ser/thr protein phosphatase family protein [Entamoeba histolytica KU27]EMS15097.1 ser/thr protein phosphatase family protein [Entamoeba histolytica HM-3:IMSS]ENY64092.1 ser/thr protein phosphatase family protein, putative [Entamoeba histolytica HM-1:IMSS-A]GAT95579.1 Ser Thr protein phosphatase family protein [Entamoeba histolytica]EAL44226.1 ser/thr protein phosphatase family protein [Entamoeba histolyti|eukprot:XP_649612.1 ser/thr protein phosphatase family protein [Entamoeba histolytica HM-1:IMSS]